MLVPERFLEITHRNLNEIALVFNSEEFTYSEICSRSHSISEMLIATGAKPGSIVGVLTERSPDLICALLGVLRAGAAYVPLETSHPIERLRYIVKDAGARIILTDSPNYQVALDIAPHSYKVINLDKLDTGSPLSSITRTSSPTDLAYIMYTSGSTGRPKGVMIEHGALDHFLQAIIEKLSITPSDSFLAATTISFDISILEIFAPLMTGARIVLSPHGIGANPQGILDLIAKHRVNRVQATPSGWRLLLAAGWQGDTNTVALCGGENLPQKLARELFSRVHALWNLYGPTEATVWATASKIVAPNAHPCLGTPLGKIQATVVDSDGRPINKGIGELLLSGPSLARGYLNQPELSARQFYFHPILNQRVYRTGDLVEVKDDGSLSFLGRIDSQVKIRGHRIELGEIEAVIEEHPLVSKAAVVASASDSGDRIIGFVSLHAADDTQRSLSISNWHQVWDKTYADGITRDPRFNISGWNDSYSGLPMQAAQVKEWVDHSVKRILSLKPKRVLEIGCGTGLLLFRIAPEVAHYHGTDISSEAVQCIQRNLGDLTNRVSLSCIAAHELTPEQLSDYDLVIINSVIQYFPNFSYLKDLLSKLGQALPPNARIFLGDIRNFDLLETFHTSVQLVRSKDEGTIQDLNRRIQSRIAQEQGLLLSPKLFYRLSEEVPTLSLSRIELKRGQFVNELSKFRFDATLTVTRTESRKARNAELSRLIWGQDLEDLLGLDAILQSERRLPYLLERIPNNRIVCDMQTIEWLKVAPRAQSINSLRVELSKNATSGIEPESMHSIGESRKYNVYMSDSPNHLGFIDALFVPMEMGQKIEVPYPYPLLPTNEPLSVFAHTPKAPQSERALTREIMSHLNSRLPSYMVPANLVVLPDMPLTSSGKIDVRALPAPIQDRSEVMAEYKAPSTATEIWICEELQRLILIDTVGLHDNFFELGADSLNIVELVNRAQSRFSVSISLGAIFDSPTVAAIARELERAQQGSPIDSRGPSNVELFNDKELPDAYWVKPNMPLGNIDAPQSFFLTGATGFLGAFILERLLRATTSRIVCIVRAQSNQEASHRVKANLQRFGLWHDHFAARVECIAGDLGQPLFGLSADDYHQIASNIDVIIHNAAQVNLLYPYSALRHSNVMATRGILDFAVANRTKRLHFVSSLAVLETPEFSSSIEEPSEWRALHPETLSGGYAQTKWVCEELVWEAYRRGLPCSISRPGSVNSFRSLRGVLAHDLQMALLEEFVHYGKVPSFDWAMDLTPAEYVAEAILQASLNREFDGKCLHLVTKQSISKSDLVAELKRRDIPCQEIPYSDWISGVKERKQGPLRPFLSILTPGGANSEPYLRRSSTNLKCFSRVSEDILIRYHVEPPPSARELAVKVLDEIAAAQVTTSYSSGTGI